MIESAEEFLRLRTSEDPVHYRRAAHEPAPLSVWRDVIHRFPDMRSWVAKNKTVPLEILSLLAEDEDPKVRFAVAMKRKLDRDLFERLSRDLDETVRVRVAANRKTPQDIVARLLNDPSALVREAAQAQRNA